MFNNWRKYIVQFFFGDEQAILHHSVRHTPYRFTQVVEHGENSNTCSNQNDDDQIAEQNITEALEVFHWLLVSCRENNPKAALLKRLSGNCYGSSAKGV
jgi:hypothetical protein